MMYARKKTESQPEIVGTGQVELSELDEDMRQFFSEESVRAQHLVFEPAVAFRQKVKAEAYEKTVMPEPQVKERLNVDIRKYTDVEYNYVEPETPSAPFFYVSRYQI
jgi:hypothetical protein